MSNTRGLSPDPNFIPRPPSAKFHNRGPAPERPAQVEVRPAIELPPNGPAPKQEAPSEKPWDALVREDPAQAMRVTGPSMGEVASSPETRDARNSLGIGWNPKKPVTTAEAVNADPLGTAAEAALIQRNETAIRGLMADARDESRGTRITKTPESPEEATAKEGKWYIANAAGTDATLVNVPKGIVAKAVAEHAPTINAQNSMGFNMSPKVEISQINLEGKTYTAVQVSSISTMPEGKQFDPNNTKDSFFTRAKDVLGATVDNMRNGLKHVAAGIDRTATTLVVYNEKGERVAAKNSDGWIYGR